MAGYNPSGFMQPSAFGPSNDYMSLGSGWGSPVSSAPGGIPSMNLGGSAVPIAQPMGAGAGTDWWSQFKGLMGGAVGTPNAPGWGGLALGAGQGLMNGYLGLQQLGLAKDAFKESKAQFAKNFEAQRTTTNAALNDRQRARVASNPGAYQSVGDYMQQNGI